MVAPTAAHWRLHSNLGRSGIERCPDMAIGPQSHNVSLSQADYTSIPGVSASPRPSLSKSFILSHLDEQRKDCAQYPRRMEGHHDREGKGTGDWVSLAHVWCLLAECPVLVTHPAGCTWLIEIALVNKPVRHPCFCRSGAQEKQLGSVSTCLGNGDVDGCDSFLPCPVYSGHRPPGKPGPGLCKVSREVLDSCPTALKRTGY